MSQDLALNNSPITMLVYWGGLSGADANTPFALLIYVPLISNIPNISILITNK